MLSKLFLSHSLKSTFLSMCCALVLIAPARSQEFEPGIVDPFQSQLPVSLWDNDSANDASTLLRGLKPAQNSTINRLRVIIALSQSRPALSADNSGSINAARLNMLINHGVMDAAEALAQNMIWYQPTIRAEVETIALLTTRPDRYCSRLLAKQYSEIEPGLKIYCMVRSNKWQEAIDTFQIEKEALEVDRRTTLLRFLEVDGENNPILDLPWTEVPKPFDFIMDEAFGRPRGDVPMPPSYIYYAREIGSTPLAKLEYTEALTRWGALPENVLFASYRSYRGPDTGQVIDRVNMSKTIASIDPAALPNNFGDILSDAMARFSDGGLIPAFASQIAPRFTKIDLNTIDNNSTRNKIIRLAILGGWSRADWSKYVARDDFPLVLAFSLRHPEVDFDDLINLKLPTKQSRVIKTAFFDEQVKIEYEKSAGVEVLLALNILDNFIAYSDDEIVRAFRVLLQSGQEQYAKDIAINMLYGGAMP